MNKNILLFTITVFALFACSDIFNVSPQDKLSEDNVWNDESLIRAYMNGVYSDVFPNSYGLFRDYQIGNATDEFHSIKNAGNYFIIQRGDLSTDSNIHEHLHSWSNSYNQIRNINVFFERIDDAPVPEGLKSEMKAEMTFLRAYIYANLIWRYDGVPIITEIFDLDDDFSITRDSYDDTVEFIISELDNSIAVLPDRFTGSDLGKPSSDAARALKSRVLLYAASKLNNPDNDQTKWQRAADAAEELIGSYELYPDYHLLFLEGGNEEIIFARYYTQANSHALNQQGGRNGDHGWGSATPSHNLVKAYEMSNGEFPYLPDGSINPQSGFDPQNPYENRDPRLHASILYNGSVWMGRTTETFVDGRDSPTGPVESWNASLSGYYQKKSIDESIPPTGTPENATSPSIIFRYAEILLNYAEAKFELSDEETAREILNRVRARPGVEMPDVTASGEELRARIHHERRIELAFEEHRYFDVRRWMIADETESKDIVGIRITRNPDGTMNYEDETPLISREWPNRQYLLPIPQAEIDRSLGGLTQNPGY